MSLASIPVWVHIYFAWTTLIGSTPPAPTSIILLQLGLFLMLPVALGMWIGRAFQREVENWRSILRTTSIF